MRIFRRQELLMGNRFVLGVVGERDVKAEQALSLAVDEIKRIESLLSTYQDSSIINKINRKAGVEAIEVPEEVFQLIQRAQKISKLTDGAFDLTYGSLDKDFWNFNQQMTKLPNPSKAKAAVSLINYQHIELNANERSVYLNKKGVRIGFGGIGKGYAADRAKKVLLDEGFENGLVNASGDLCAWGKDEKGEDWQIALSNPDAPLEVLAQIPIRNYAVATSGTYEKFVWIDGVKYSHTINPKTGYPVRGIKSVTVIAPYAELADALTTPVTVMGAEAGVHLLNQLQGIAGIMVTDNNQIVATKNLNTKEFILN
ncbi:MAG: hypothetical protein RI995_961 [Bacteroidota bacterium]